LDFEGPHYEGTALPSSDATDPVWDLGAASPSEAAVAGSDGQFLTLNVLSAGSIAYYLPGPYGAEAAPEANRHYILADPENPWVPDNVTLGYTFELSTEVIDSAPGSWGYSLYWGEGYGGALTHIQIFKDQITSHNGQVLYTGDLTGKQNRIRILRYPGRMDDPFANPYMELYVNRELVYTGYPWNGSTGIMFNAGPYQAWMFMGSLAGSARYHVKTDYLRMDFTGLYLPSEELECGEFGYLAGDFNRDCVIDIQDLVTIANAWLLCSDPADPTCLNCNDPANAAYCR
jgi:hypothetical protein